MCKKLLLISTAIICIFLILLGLLFYFGIVHFNNPSFEKYPIRGVDVSSYQGDIDWEEISTNNIHFAFVKATEGSTFVDSHFKTNWNESNTTKLYIGAYHFFSFESSGITQANNYISTVGELTTYNLPPVIDVEYYNKKLDVSVSNVRNELLAMAVMLENYYGKKPVLYVTKETYTDIVLNYLDNYTIWIRGVYEEPDYLGGDEWSFWQFSNRHVLDGYSGQERYIDMNVYNGTFDKFLAEFSLKEKE